MEPILRQITVQWIITDDDSSKELESREPTVEDMRDLCRELNLRGAKYVVVGGFAIRAANYIRQTMAVDLPWRRTLKTRSSFFLRMKAVTHREKDSRDLYFLRHGFAERGEEPPKV
jgi:hypothetical protein